MRLTNTKGVTTIDNLLPRLKLECDEGYDVAVKGAGVVV
jgi:hypothetical protein